MSEPAEVDTAGPGVPAPRRARGSAPGPRLPRVVDLTRVASSGRLPELLPTLLPPPRDRTTVGPGVTGPTALALFYLIGGALTLLSVLLPGWEGVDRSTVLAVAVAALLSGGLVLALRERLSDASCHVLVALGSLIVGGAMVVGAGGPATSAYSSFFFFVAVYAALFFGPRAAAAHLAWACAVHVGALAVLGTGGIVASTLVLFGGTGTTAVVVGALVRQVRATAATDPLTRLPNRRAFDQHLAAALGRADRSGRPLALLALDLDGFKAVNDREGHAAGDRLLVRAGRSWLGALRKGDVLARSGGDEFVVLLPEADGPTARQVAGRLAARTPAPLGVSVGIAVSRPGEGADALLRRADAALYRQKRRR
jgi:diguanylate cyclase (GGDEF)-like protein